jgi:opacity protein-like surface antigen
MARGSRLAALALLCLALPAAARAGGDLFGGYSFERANALNRHGWNASLAVGLTGPLALEADGSVHYGSKNGVDRDQLTLMGGARFSLLRGGKVAPFVHALVGLLRERAGIKILDITIGEDENRFGILFGGGVDVKVGERFAVRLLGDYEHSSQAGHGQSGFRVSVGAVLRFGPR